MDNGTFIRGFKCLTAGSKSMSRDIGALLPNDNPLTRDVGALTGDGDGLIFDIGDLTFDVFSLKSSDNWLFCSTLRRNQQN